MQPQRHTYPEFMIAECITFCHHILDLNEKEEKDDSWCRILAQMSAFYHVNLPSSVERMSTFGIPRVLWS
jgi:hypothetical protein